jgi:hypothetical protein
MSIETNWCLSCKNHTKEIPHEHKEEAELHKKYYKYVIFCKKFNVIVVANDNMWIDMATTCEGFER